ncbi:MAG: hypothetical protein CMJ84_14525 [Planctomycetes bacterium]|nr:hypothetical protein [Planctomycetota bacterium]
MPWHDEQAAYRAVVAVASKSDAKVDVAAVRIRHCGLVRADGHDYRIFDQAGTATPYEITHHDPDRDTLISLRCDDPSMRFVVYFGRSSSDVDPMRATRSGKVGEGPPRPGPGAGGWIPRTGLVLTTLRRPVEADNPRTPEALQAMIDAATPDGAAYRSAVSDSYNPFGDSDYFISIYRGWLRIAKDGRYGFCTASNEASFSFLDGKELVHWPGRHTEQRGKHGQKSRDHELRAGLHYVEYYHEEVLLYQVAFLGWRPPGADHFQGIDSTVFPQPHRAQVTQYEKRDAGRIPMIRAELLDSAWPLKRSRGQYTRFRFTTDGGDGAPWTQVAWSFGDGQTAVGAEAEHVYLRVGAYEVKMTATAAVGGAIERRWPLIVYPVEHLDGPYRDADAKSYREAIEAFDPGALDTQDLAELIRFHDETGDAERAAALAQALLDRADAGAAELAEAHWIAASGTERRGEHLRAALKLEPDAARRMEIAARLIALTGTEGGDLAAAEAVFDEVVVSMRGATSTDRLRVAMRGAIIAIGEARLGSLQREKALEAFHLAESLAEPPVPLAVRHARIGSYHETVAARFKDGRIDDAAAVIERWRTQFPADQLRGEVHFWRGRIQLARGAARDAARSLGLAAELAEGSELEAHARFLLAQAYGDAGDEARSRQALEALIATGLAGEYRERAMKLLAGQREGAP